MAAATTGRRVMCVAGLCLTRCSVSSSDHQLVGHGGRHVQEAGEGTRLLRDRRGRGEL